MKNTLLLLLILLSLNSYGQEHSIALQSGLIVSNIDNFNDKESRIGLVAGIGYQIMYNNKLSLGIDILYSQQGANEISEVEVYYNNGSGFGLGQYSQFHLDYITTPIKIGYSFGEKLKFTPRIGIAPSILINTAFSYPTTDEIINVTNDVSKFNLEGLIELGLDYRLHNQFDLFITLNYFQSLNKVTFIDSTPNLPWNPESTFKPLAFSVSFGVKYLLKDKK